MKSDTFYFPHDFNARNDRKLIKVHLKFKMSGIGIFWSLIEMMYEENGKLPVSEIPTIAAHFREKESTVLSVINDFDLFKNDGNFFWSESVKHRMLKRLEKSEKAKASAANKWKSQGWEYSSKRSERLSEARKKGNHTKADWEEMREWFGECVKCGSTDDIVKDHIIPIYQGGSDGLDNLQPLCRSCNCSKGPDNKDYRIDWCKANACEMPANFSRMPAIKERKGKENKGKEIERGSNGADAPTPKSFKVFSEDDFKQDIARFKSDYHTNLLRDFYKYWSEKSASGKMKFQLEDTWETSKRLDTWQRNEDKFSKNGSVPEKTTSSNLHTLKKI